MGRTFIALALLFVLGACAGQSVVQGPADSATSPIRGIVNSEGKGDAQVVYVPLVSPPGQTYPITAKFVWSHDATLVFQPYPPYLIIDGDGDLIVEPTPGQESQAQELLDKGLVQIQRGGVVSNGMNAPGSVETYELQRAAREELPVSPPPPPAPETPNTDDG